MRDEVYRIGGLAEDILGGAGEIATFAFDGGADGGGWTVQEGGDIKTKLVKLFDKKKQGDRKDLRRRIFNILRVAAGITADHLQACGPRMSDAALLAWSRVALRLAAQIQGFFAAQLLGEFTTGAQKEFLQSGAEAIAALAAGLQVAGVAAQNPNRPVDPACDVVPSPPNKKKWPNYKVFEQLPHTGELQHLLAADTPHWSTPAPGSDGISSFWNKNISDLVPKPPAVNLGPSGLTGQTTAAGSYAPPAVGSEVTIVAPAFSAPQLPASYAPPGSGPFEAYKAPAAPAGIQPIAIVVGLGLAGLVAWIMGRK